MRSVSILSATMLMTLQKSIFNPTNYPTPWPLLPFSYPTERLRSCIPLYQLPKKLTVHDPWNVLAVNSANRYGHIKTTSLAFSGDSAHKSDIVHTYNLQLTPVGEARLKQELVELEAKSMQENTNAEINGAPEGMHGYFLHDRSDAPPGSIPPPIFVVHDPPPTLPVINGEPDSDSGCHAAIEEAHLYLSGAHKIGSGSHSMVYQGEWELPRTMFLPPRPPTSSPVLCKACVSEDVNNILVSEDGENGERMEERWKEKSAVLGRIGGECIKPSVGVRFSYDGPGGGPDSDASVQEGNVSDTVYMLVEPQKQTTYPVKFEGPVRPIQTTVQWQDPSNPTCPHLRVSGSSNLPNPTPPTAKVRIAAKLSNDGDTHLGREAQNYQNFDQHMFQHYSGLNKVPPLHDVCPVGALVPQFYGYYVPQLKEDEEAGCIFFSNRVPVKTQVDGVEGQASKKVVQGYLSPILLLEDCGSCITLNELGYDDGYVDLVHARYAYVPYRIPGSN